MEAITSFLRSISANKADGRRPGEAPAPSKAQGGSKEGDKPPEMKGEKKPDRKGEKPAAETPVAKPAVAKPAAGKPKPEPKPEARAKEEAKGRAETAASPSAPADPALPPIRVLEDLPESMDRCADSAHRTLEPWDLKRAEAACAPRRGSPGPLSPACERMAERGHRPRPTVRRLRHAPLFR